jgi:hypothetical protein
VTSTTIDVRREWCEYCGLPIPLAGLRFISFGTFVACADQEACTGRLDRSIERMKAVSPEFRALCAWED